MPRSQTLLLLSRCVYERMLTHLPAATTTMRCGAHKHLSFCLSVCLFLSLSLSLSLLSLSLSLSLSLGFDDSPPPTHPPTQSLNHVSLGTQHFPNTRAPVRTRAPHANSLTHKRHTSPTPTPKYKNTHMHTRTNRQRNTYLHTKKLCHTLKHRETHIHAHTTHTRTHTHTLSHSLTHLRV